MIDDKPRRVRIIEPGLTSYTGPIGYHNFVDGVSDLPIDWVEANRIGAAMQIEDADVPGYQISPAINMFRHRDIAADDPLVLADGKTIEVDGQTIYIKEVMTREELENIADKKGLQGLREIATRWSVGARSINDMIDRILEAQVQAQTEQQSAV